MSAAPVEIVTALARYLPEDRVDDACQLLRREALPKLEMMAAEIRAVSDSATSKPLADDVDEGKAAELVSRGVIALKELDALRRSHVDPLNAEVKAINGLFKLVTDPCEALVLKGGSLERLILAYRAEKQARIAREEAEARRKQEEAARKEAEALARVEAAKTSKAREKAMAEAAAASKAQTEALIEAPREMTKGVRTDSGTLSERERWVFKVVNPSLVPPSYCMPDEQAIRSAVARGVREIEGVAIYVEESLTRRSGR